MRAGSRQMVSTRRIKAICRKVYSDFDRKYIVFSGIFAIEDTLFHRELNSVVISQSTSADQGSIYGTILDRGIQEERRPQRPE